MCCAIAKGQLLNSRCREKVVLKVFRTRWSPKNRSFFAMVYDRACESRISRKILEKRWSPGKGKSRTVDRGSFVEKQKHYMLSCPVQRQSGPLGSLDSQKNFVEPKKN